VGLDLKKSTTQSLPLQKESLLSFRYHTGYATRTYWNIALDNTIFCLGDLILNPFIGRVRKAANTPESVIAFTIAIAGLGDIGKNIFSHLAG